MVQGFCIRCTGESEALTDAGLCPGCAGVMGSAPEMVVAGSVVGEPLVSADEGRLFPTVGSVPVGWVPEVGDVLLDTYEVRGELGAGEGAMGVVHRVHHRGWNLDLAVKSHRSGVGGFAAEAEAWVDLGLHPHIVTCHYVRELGGVPRVFAELVEGGSLKEWIVVPMLPSGAGSWCRTEG